MMHGVPAWTDPGQRMRTIGAKSDGRIGDRAIEEIYGD